VSQLSDSALDAERIRVALALSRNTVSMRTTTVPEAKAYYPTPEEFADPCAYIAKISPAASAYGICRVIPPPNWNPPCSLAARMASTTKYKTRLQAVHSLAEGLPFPDGNLYTFAEYKAMADSFKATKCVAPSHDSAAMRGQW
jgi:hypothetical protein